MKGTRLAETITIKKEGEKGDGLPSTIVFTQRTERPGQVIRKRPTQIRATDQCRYPADLFASPIRREMSTILPPTIAARVRKRR